MEKESTSNSENSSDIKSDATSGLPENGACGNADCAEVAEAEKTNADENLEMFRIESRLRNRRTACSCLCFVVLVAALSVSFIFHRGCSSVDKAVHQTVSTAGNAISSAVSTVKDFINKNPDVQVSYGAEYLGGKSENKYVIAGVDEKITQKADFTKLKIMSGSVELNVVAHYQYYIPLRGMRFKILKSREAGKLDFIFFFDSLKCDTPVKYSEISCKVSQSKFSGDVNGAIEKYQISEFPRYLEDRAKNSQNMLSARVEAEVALRKYVRQNIMPYAGVPDSEIGEIEIVFDSAEFDNFKTGFGRGEAENWPR